jgi:urease gamma subunit
MATLYVTLQGKGGVGKSYLTAAFAQWLVEQGRSVACIDTDTLNPTLLQYAPLKATHLKLSQNHVIDPRALDTLVGIVAEAPDDGQVVVDVGSNGFETLMADEVENGVFALLQELGHRVVVQTVIAGGPDAEETVKGTMALLAATDVPVILLAERASGSTGDSVPEWGPPHRGGVVPARGAGPDPRDLAAAGPDQGDLRQGHRGDAPPAPDLRRGHRAVRPDAAHAHQAHPR